MSHVKRSTVIGTATLFFLSAQSAFAACTSISVLPYTISSPGQYCVTANLAHTANTNAITIQANDVTLDLGGWTLRGPYADATSSTSGGAGIYGVTNNNNIVIKNGTIKGYWSGISMGANNATVENLRVIDSPYQGIALGGTSNTLVSNQVVLNSTVYTGSQNLPGFGIAVGGKHVKITNNKISYITNYYSSGYPDPKGISVSNVFGGTIENNSISGNQILNIDYEAGKGIYLQVCDNMFVNGNQISKFANGIHFNGGAGYVYRNNSAADIYNAQKYVISNASVTDAGGNY